MNPTELTEIFITPQYIIAHSCNLEKKAIKYPYQVLKFQEN